jgi:hypothetical protein
MRWLLPLLATLLLAPQAHAQGPPWEAERIAQLESENRKLRRHLSNYGSWVRKEIREKRALARRAHRGWYEDSEDAVQMAAVAFGQSEDVLLRKARCESGMWPYAANPSSDATGLFQILYPGTWRTTPFAQFSPWSPYANALAAAWMHRAGRGREWVCR